jgi:hypothetical protein
MQIFSAFYRHIARDNIPMSDFNSNSHALNGFALDVNFRRY